MLRKINSLKRLTYKFVFVLGLASCLAMAFPQMASAVDGVSFADCPQQFTWGTYNIKNSDGKVLGYFRVYSCQYGFFVRTVNTAGSAKWTYAILERWVTRTNQLDTSQSAGGKYSSVTNQLTKQSGYCYKAHGSIHTYAYGAAGRSFTFACL